MVKTVRKHQKTSISTTVWKKMGEEGRRGGQEIGKEYFFVFNCFFDAF